MRMMIRIGAAEVPASASDSRTLVFLTAVDRVRKCDKLTPTGKRRL